MVAAAWLTVGCGAELRPNVLLISIDTLRADHLDVYGYARETAPALTQLARAGALFDRSYSQSSSTVPTHASLFTGRFPFQHGAYHVGLSVSDAELTLAELFSQAGYRTFAATSSVRFRGQTGFDQGFDVFERFDELAKNQRSAAVTTRVLEWVAADDGPWFGFVHYFDPHQPYAPPEPWRTRWHRGLPRPTPEATSDYLYFFDRPERPVPADVLEYLRALYDGEIGFLDSQLERLFASLAPQPGRRGSLVVVTSDHGEEFKEHGGLSHSRRLYEELLRVPLVFWWPGRIAAGTRIARPVQTVDVFPTLLELAAISGPEGLPGRSRAAELLSSGHAPSPESPGDPVLAQIHESRWALTAELEGGRFKYVSRDDVPHRLFDLTTDPGERRDLLAERPAVARALRALAAEIGVEAASETQAPGSRPEPISEAVRERLREIGYVEEAEAAP
jgi:arylsulfatase A-like enzyme